MSGLDNNIKNLLTQNWYAWFLPASVVFLLPFESLLYVPLVIMALAGLVIFFRKKIYKDCWKHTNHRILIIAFSLIWLPMLFSLPDAVNTVHSLKTTLSVFPYFFAGVFIVHSLNTDEKRNILNLILLIILLFWVADALIQYAFNANLFGNETPIKTRLTGIFHPKYTLGLILAVFLPFVLEQLRKISTTVWKKLASIIIASLYISVIVLSGGRNPFVILIVGLILWFYFIIVRNSVINWKVLSLVLILGSSLVLFLASTQERSRLLYAFKNVSELNLKTVDRMTHHRLELWEVATKISLDHWINGIGPRGFRYAYSEYKPEAGKYAFSYDNAQTHPHFALLEIAAETGAIGFISIIILICFLVKISINLPPKQAYSVCPWFICVFIAIIPNIAKAFYSTSWVTVVLLMLYIGIANIKNEPGHNVE